MAFAPDGSFRCGAGSSLHHSPLGPGASPGAPLLSPRHPDLCYVPASPDGADGLRSGAELYAEPSVTGLNCQPVDDHLAFALLGARPSAAPPVDLDELTLRLLHSGSVALLDSRCSGGGAGYACLDGLAPWRPDSEPPGPAWLPLTERSCTQRFAGAADGEPALISRVFAQGDHGWEARDYRADEAGGAGSGLPGPDGWRLIAARRLPAEALRIYPGGLGVLFKAQRAYRRLEAIFAAVARLQSGVNSKTIVSGYIGNAEQAHAELSRGDRDVALFPSGASVHRVASTAAIDQLLAEFEVLLPLYLRRLHIALPDPREPLSGVSRRLALAPLLAFVEGVRRRIEAVLADCGVAIGFERIRLETYAERAQKYDLLRLLQRDGVLDGAQLRSAALGLLDA